MTRLAVILLTLVSFVGCSLVDPFVTRGLRPGQPRDNSKPAAAPSTTVTVSIGEAFEYAELVKDRYRDALRDHALLQSWLGIGLIPLTAAAIGVGARGGAPNAVLGMGLGGASALGVGTWLYNKPHQLAWVAGLKAVTCAEDAMAPLNLPGSTETMLDTDIKRLRIALQTLDEKVATLETEADKAKAVREGANTNRPEIAGAIRSLESLEVSARAELKEVPAERVTAEAALTNGAELQQVLRVAGGRLVVAVSKITDEVDGIVVDTQRDPQALATVIAGLGSSYRTLTAVPEGIAPQVAKEKSLKQDLTVPQSKILRAAPGEAEKAPPSELDTRRAGLAAALQSVREEEAKTASARREVSNLVNSVVKDTPIDKLKGCGVTAGDLKTALSVDPADPYEITKPGIVSFTMKGGLPPYGAALAGGLAGLSVAQSAPFSPAVNVVATKDTPEGQFAVVVSDTSGQTKTVRVKVNAGDGKQDSGDPKSTATAALNQFAEKLTKEQPPISVSGVTTKVTKAEVSGDRVVVSIDEPKVASNAVVDNVFSNVVKEDLWKNHGGEELKIPKEKIAFDNSSLKMLNKDELDKKKARPQSRRLDQDPQFSTLDLGQRQKVQTVLCLTGNEVDGQWGPITKGKVLLYQRRAGLPKQDGVLTKDLVDKLLSLNETQIKNDYAAR